MAARLKGRGRLKRHALLLGLMATVAVAGCAPESSGQQGGQPAVPQVTPEASYSAQIAGTALLVTNALAAVGIRADPPSVPYVSGEPADIATAQRIVLQADVHDPNGGYVVIYEFTDPATSATRGAEFASYLESGFGQTNFPIDAQFSLTEVGGTLIFTWWSSDNASDRDTARTAFDAIASVGVPITIVK